MKRAIGLGAMLLLAVLAVLLFWSPADAPQAAVQPERLRTISQAAPKRSTPPVVPAEPAVVAPDDSDAPAIAERVPVSPAEAALFAWADASGMSVIRCTSDQLPEGFEPSDDDLMTEAGVTRMVPPNQDSDWSSMLNYMGYPSYVQRHKGAFVGAVGACEIIKANPSRLRMTEAQLEAFTATTNDSHAVELDDVEDTMHPIQIALESPDLSPEARAWLVAKLAQVEATALDVEDLSVEEFEEKYRDAIEIIPADDED